MLLISVITMFFGHNVELSCVKCSLFGRFTSSLHNMNVLLFELFCHYNEQRLVNQIFDIFSPVN